MHAIGKAMPSPSRIYRSSHGPLLSTYRTREISHPEKTIQFDCRCGIRTYELICMVERVGTAVPSDRYTALRQLSASPVIVLPSDARPGFW